MTRKAGNKMGEIKQANFRIDTETAAQFREFCENNGLNQAQGFDHIMQIAEMDKAKATIPERATEIEEFERHTKALLAAYLNSMEIAESTEERILEKFRGQLDSKDKIIIDLQDRLAGTEDLLAAAQSAAMDAENKVASAEKETADAKAKQKSAEQVAEDKKSIAEMLAAQLRDAEGKLKDYPNLQSSFEAQKNDLANALQEIKDIKKDAAIEQERAVNEIEIKLSRAEASVEEKAIQIEKLEQKIEKLTEKLDIAKETITALKVEQEKK